MSKKEGTKKFEFPHTLVIIMVMIIIAAILSWILPAGQYDYIEGTKTIDPNTFHYIDRNPATLFDIFRVIPDGMKQVAYISNFVLIIGAAFSVINSTGATQALMSKVMKSSDKLGVFFLPIVIVMFSALPASTGNAESMLAFVPLGIMVARSLGYDAMVGLSITIAAGNAGFASGLLNSATTGTAQSLLGIEIFSGLWFRAIGYALLLCSVIFWTVWYARRVKNDPTKSICYNVELAAKEKEQAAVDVDSTLTTRRIIILLEFVAGIAAVVYGALHKWDFGTEMACVFIIMAVVIGFTAGYSPNKIATLFVDGAKKMMVGVLVVGFSKGIAIILTEANVIHTIVHAFAGVFVGLPKVVGALFMYAFQIVLNTFIISGSGQAAATIPIVGPLGEILGLTPQTIVTAFIFGDGITNLLLPMSAATMGAVAIAEISYPQYVKYIWRIIVTNIVIGGCMVVAATLINL